MTAWPPCPVIYEINTWVWLGELSRKYGKSVDLATVPEPEWDAIGAHGFDAVWFMGVWERSPAGIEISMHNQGLLEDFRRALPDFAPPDNIGSPYCIRRYVVGLLIASRPVIVWNVVAIVINGLSVGAYLHFVRQERGQATG